MSSRLALWADGYFAEEDWPAGDPQVLLRIHRDGAAAVGRAVTWGEVEATWPAVTLDGQLLYLGQTWQTLDLRTPIELHIALEGIRELTFRALGRFPHREEVRQPTSAPAPQVTLRQDVLPADLVTPHLRHRVVRAFADRFHQAFGKPRAETLFTSGWLYRGSEPAMLSLAGGGIFDAGGTRTAAVDELGGILPATGLQRPVAFIDDGVVLDANGNALCALELACSAALPDEFATLRVMNSDLPRVQGGDPGSRFPAQDPVSPPAPTRAWSSQTLQDVLAP